MKLIAIIIIGVLLLAGAGAAITGTPAGTTTQPSQPSVYEFDILATPSHGGGTLLINLAEHKFVFDGKGEPNRTYYLQYTLKNESRIHQFASVVANPSGVLHIEGNWTMKFGSWATKLANIRSARTLGFAEAAPSDNESGTLTSEPTFMLSTTSGLTAVLSFMKSLGSTNGNIYVWVYADRSTGDIARYLVQVYKVVNGVKGWGTLYDGRNCFLANSRENLNQPFSIPYQQNYTQLRLIVYDSAGASADVTYALTPNSYTPV